MIPHNNHCVFQDRHHSLLDQLRRTELQEEFGERNIGFVTKDNNTW